ncbi:MAG: tryptophan 7-halogenase, partial [Alphaproteobacteria bacterium]|nr:tryptophan 7-halogenase [Alphaproteobacteria bacterium]
MTSPDPGSGSATIKTYDVIVIGGGPGGAAVAILLAEAGLKVVIIEKERHPRFHIGESLLPHSLPMLKRLGVLDRVHEIGVFKPGAEFISEDGSKNNVFNFDRALTEGPDHAYQVRRDDFDKILFDRAREAGATTLEETTATIQSCDDSAATVAARMVDGSDYLFHADFLVDASGRSTITAKWREEIHADRKNNSAAIFGHFRDIPRAEGPRGGNIRIYLTNPGWMWQIPLPDGVTSVGLVVPGELIATRDRSVE